MSPAVRPMRYGQRPRKQAARDGTNETQRQRPEQWYRNSVSGICHHKVALWLAGTKEQAAGIRKVTARQKRVAAKRSFMARARHELQKKYAVWRRWC